MIRIIRAIRKYTILVQYRRNTMMVLYHHARSNVRLLYFYKYNIQNNGLMSMEFLWYDTLIMILDDFPFLSLILNIGTIPSWVFLSDYIVPLWYYFCDGTKPNTVLLALQCCTAWYCLRDDTAPPPYINTYIFSCDCSSRSLPVCPSVRTSVRT